MNDPEGLSDFPTSPKGRAEARDRLRGAIAGERRRRRGRSFAVRSLAAGFVLFVGWALFPDPPDREVLPLLGLADAVAGVTDASSHLWYSRAERTDLVEVPPEVLEPVGVDELRFLLPSVQEAWLEAGEMVRSRTTYGSPRFLAPGDERIFAAAGLADLYPVGQTVDGPLEGKGFLPVEVSPRDRHRDVLERLRRQVAGRGDSRREEVRMLGLAADLMRRYAGQPSVRGVVLRVIADIPGIDVREGDGRVAVSVDYLDGDRPLRLMYEFDAETAQLVGESLAVLATMSEPETVLSQASYEPRVAARIES